MDSELFYLVSKGSCKRISFEHVASVEGVHFAFGRMAIDALRGR